MQKFSISEERALIAAAQQGDRAAMERIVRQYAPLVRAAGRHPAVRTVADDAAAAAAEELVRAVYAYDLARGIPFAAYARVRVRGAVSHFFRKAARVWAHESTPGDDAAMERAPGADALAAADARLALAPALSRLDAAERRVLQLLFFEGRTTREAAGILGVTQSKLARTKQRALETLREALEP